MQTTRRDFVKYAAATGAAAGLSTGLPTAWASSLSQSTEAAKKLNLLILGGTGFIGPHIVNEAISRGHTMTLFNRGKSNPEMFAHLEQLTGNRDPDIDEGLTALEGREFDGVIDTSGYVPRIVGASAGLLAGHTKQYVFVSSISVYAAGAEHGMTEDAELATMEDETNESVGEYYGALKALCEQTADKAMDGRCANVRPGFIVGPLDRALNRFPLWTMRAAKRERLLAPGAPDDPVQLIDARDLAAFIIRSLEQSITGPFNLVGPADPLTNAEMVSALLEGCGATPAPEVTWVSDAFMEAQAEATKKPMPTVPCVPAASDSRGYATVSNAAAVKAGYASRSVVDTSRDTWKWLANEASDETRDRVAKIMAGTVEDDLLTAWDAREQDG